MNFSRASHYADTEDIRRAATSEIAATFKRSTKHHKEVDLRKRTKHHLIYRIIYISFPIILFLSWNRLELISITTFGRATQDNKIVFEQSPNDPPKAQLDSLTAPYPWNTCGISASRFETFTGHGKIRAIIARQSQLIKQRSNESTLTDKNLSEAYWCESFGLGAPKLARRLSRLKKLAKEGSL